MPQQDGCRDRGGQRNGRADPGDQRERLRERVARDAEDFEAKRIGELRGHGRRAPYRIERAGRGSVRQGPTKRGRTLAAVYGRADAAKDGDPERPTKLGARFRN